MQTYTQTHMQQKYLTAKEVTRELGISFGTLYSYVSRGLIRSEETDGQTRHKRYWAEDVENLRSRRERRRNPTASAATALDFGDPVLESAITLIQDGNLYYRGHSVVDIACREPVEHIAGLLWQGELVPELSPLPTPGAGLTATLPVLLSTLGGLTPVERFQALLPVAESQDLAAHDKTPAGVCRTGARIYALFLTALTGESPTSNPSSDHSSEHRPDSSLAEQVAAWALGSRTAHVPPHIQPHVPRGGLAIAPADAELFNAALILCADHELNVSSFTARCVASTGATPYGAVAAALAALQGPRHGGDAARCEALLRDAQVNPRQALAAWLRRGERLPGFGHRLYPQGDPRAQVLLDLLRTRSLPPENGHFRPALHMPSAAATRPTTPTAPPMTVVDELSAEVAQTFALHPTIDMALAALALAYRLPPGASLTLFTAGRLLGWIAHIIEQYESDTLIRPRASYSGPQAQ